MHEAEASTIESHAGEAEYAAAAQEAKSSTGGGELPSWEPALFLLVGSSLTLWLLLTGHLRAAGQAIGWIPLGSGTAKSSPLNKARQVAHG